MSQVFGSFMSRQIILKQNFQSDNFERKTQRLSEDLRKRFRPEYQTD